MVEGAELQPQFITVGSNPTRTSIFYLFIRAEYLLRGLKEGVMMKSIDAGSPAHWAGIRARVLAEKVSATTIRMVDEFEEKAKTVKSGMIYETYVSDIANLAYSKYKKLVSEIGVPDAFSDETEKAFMEACANRVGMPEICDDPEEIAEEAHEAQRDAIKHMYGDDYGDSFPEHDIDADPEDEKRYRDEVATWGPEGPEN